MQERSHFIKKASPLTPVDIIAGTAIQGCTPFQYSGCANGYNFATM